jgi:hypothetical protein
MRIQGFQNFDASYLMWPQAHANLPKFSIKILREMQQIRIKRFEIKIKQKKNFC